MKDDYISYGASKAYEYGAPIVKQWVADKYQSGVRAGLNELDIISKQLAGSIRSSLKSGEGSIYGVTSKKRNYESTMSSQASNFGSYSQQSDSASQAKSAADTINGHKGNQTTTGNVVPSMVRSGYGAELSFTSNSVNAPIRHKTGEAAGPPPKDPFKAELELYRGLSINMDFAFRMHLPANLFSTQYHTSRAYQYHVFRHYNNNVYGTTPTSIYGNQTTFWNNSLGPDNALIRQATPAGTSTAAQAAAYTAAGLNNTLTSAVRFAPEGALCYPRLNMQCIENVGWACNPNKVISQSANGASSILDSSPKLVYANSSATFTGGNAQSFPAQQPKAPGTLGNSPYYYRSQNSKGCVTYTFNNDSTLPAVVDIVIIKLKRGEQWDPLAAPTLLDDVIQDGYARKVSSVSNLASFSGASPALQDPLQNSRVQFIPNFVWKHSANLDGNSTVTNAYASQPFKPVSRDQFMISSGASRAWSFEMPSLDYDPRRVGVSNSNVAGTPVFCNDNTYIVAIAISTPNIPLIEQGTTGAALNGNYSIVDRRSADVSVSCTGTYSEHALPAYLSSNTVRTVQAFGTLDQPFYATPPTVAGTLTYSSIANSGQAIRSSTESSALLNVGSVSTQGF